MIAYGIDPAAGGGEPVIAATTDGMTRILHPRTAPIPTLQQQASDLTARWHKMVEDLAVNLVPVMRRIGASLTWGLASPERRQVILAGWEQRYYVRASVDPTVDPVRLSLAVCASRDPETAWMGPRERAVVAAAVIRGHVEHHEVEATGVLAWHRLIGTTCVEVSRG